MKKVSIPFYLASRAIRRGNKGTLVLTILVVAMSFVLMVFLPSLVGGITGAYTKQVTDYQYGNLVIDPDDDHTFISDFWIMLFFSFRRYRRNGYEIYN